MIQDNRDRLDGWTKIASAGELFTSFISDGYWLAGLFDAATGFEGNALPISWYGLAFGCVVALLSASGATYCHTILNKNHQPFTAPENTNEVTPLAIDIESQTYPEKTAKLTALQYVALFGDLLSHTGEIAGPITFVTKLATQSKLSRWASLSAQCGATLFGMASSIANVRTCKRNMEEANARTRCLGS